MLWNEGSSEVAELSDTTKFDLMTGSAGALVGRMVFF